MLTVEQIDELLAENERIFRDAKVRYEQEKAGLFQLRAVRSGSLSSVQSPAPLPKSAGKRASARDEFPAVATLPGHPLDGLSNRDIVRHFILEQDGDFTFKDLLKEASTTPSEKAQTMDRMAWSSALWNFAKQGLLEEVVKRKGNKPAVYRRLTEDLSPPKNESESEFPLTKMVRDAIGSLNKDAFTRKDIFQKVLEMHPEHAERLRPDTVGAIINREASHKTSGFRLVEKSQLGNIYEREKVGPHKQPDLINNLSEASQSSDSNPDGV